MTHIIDSTGVLINYVKAYPIEKGLEDVLNMACHFLLKMLSRIIYEVKGDKLITLRCFENHKDYEK